MDLEDVDLPGDKPTSRLGRAAARCRALLLTRIYECLPLQCPHCGTSMRITATQNGRRIGLQDLEIGAVDNGRSVR